MGQRHPRLTGHKWRLCDTTSVGAGRTRQRQEAASRQTGEDRAVLGLQIIPQHLHAVVVSVMMVALPVCVAVEGRCCVRDRIAVPVSCRCRRLRMNCRVRMERPADAQHCEGHALDEHDKHEKPRPVAMSVVPARQKWLSRHTDVHTRAEGVWMRPQLGLRSHSGRMWTCSLTVRLQQFGSIECSRANKATRTSARARYPAVGPGEPPCCAVARWHAGVPSLPLQRHRLPMTTNFQSVASRYASDAPADAVRSQRAAASTS
jgi:hypothetical protein